MNKEYTLLKLKASISNLKARWKISIPLLALILLFTIFFSLNLGFIQIPFQDIFMILLKKIFDPLTNLPLIGNYFTIALTPSQISVEQIVLMLRLPRVLSGALVGAALATAGVIFQAMFRNPMADPYTTSASQGAALGAALAIVLGLGFSFFGLNSTPIFAFIGCIISVLVVYLISRTGSTVPVTTLLLSGIAVGIFELAIVTYLQTMSHEKLGELTFWLIGSLSSSRTLWSGVLSITPFILIGIFLAYLFSRDLNLLTLGEEQAQHLGVNLERSKLILLVLGAILTGAAVAVSGLIGFIGLMIPHVTRLIVGPDHRVLIPASVLFGATFLVICDGITRMLTVLSQQVPVGVITALIGVVFFLFLMRKKKRGVAIG